MNKAKNQFVASGVRFFRSWAVKQVARQMKQVAYPSQVKRRQRKMIETERQMKQIAYRSLT